MPPTIRPATAEELPDVLDAVSRGFLGDRRPDEDASLTAVMDLARTRCAFEGAEIVGTLGAFDLELAVPGATLPTAGTTLITVRGTHRRKGLLNAMMGAHFEDVRERGEPLAALWASESSIYRRFGYGPASDVQRISLKTDHAAFVGPEASRCRLVTEDEATKLLPPIYEALWRNRPGQLARTAAWWEHRCLADLPATRMGMSAWRTAVYEQAGRASGYARYRVKEDWGQDGLAHGSLVLFELMGAEPETLAALWRHLLDVDLVERVTAWNVPVDCELPWLLADPRRAVRGARDGLWVRIMDVCRALEARRYAAAGALVLEIRDAFWPEAAGGYRLEVGLDGARCERSDATPELQLDIADLGAAYLGGRSLRALARAGRVRGTPEALARADAMFGWDPAPWCPELF